MTKKKVRSRLGKEPDLDAEIFKGAYKWVRQNKGLIWKKEHGYYSSPRVSSEIMDCSMPMTFDHYSFCQMGCQYCFAYFFKSNNPAITEPGKLRAVNTERMIAALRGKPQHKDGRMFHKHFYSRKFLLHWGGLADPFCGFEKRNRIGLPLLEALGELNYPTLFSFKGDAIFEDDYMNLFERYSKQRNFAFQVSIITGNDELARKIEVGVPSPSKRIDAIAMLHDMGYWTILRLRPFIIGITDPDLDELLERSLQAGIDGVSVEFFALDARANVGMKTRYDWLGKFIGVDDLMHYFSELSPSERGGYMRLNRHVKEPYIKKIYKFCVENDLVFGCSDPDFKELNTSGSCCAMPDNYEPNPLLENWTRSQMTYHVKEARRLYHTTGQLKELLFDEVFDSTEDTYLDELELANDHVTVIGRDCATRKALTQKLILQEQWNNLRSPANPRNYFHGKVMPINRLDSSGNLIFRYAPSGYEERWKREGIDLTK